VTVEVDVCACAVEEDREDDVGLWISDDNEEAVEEEPELKWNGRGRFGSGFSSPTFREVLLFKDFSEDGERLDRILDPFTGLTPFFIFALLAGDAFLCTTFPGLYFQ
jgi:hypothetical protein